MHAQATPVAGLLLAAGGGRRFGGPKALAERDGRAWVEIAIDALRDGGCSPLYVVTGARGDDVAALLPDDVVEVRSLQWHLGMGESLRAGLDAVGAAAVHAVGFAAVQAVLIHLVDLPDVGADVVRRLVHFASPGALARATYDGRPGHPVLIGRNWWTEVIASAHGDRGARDFLGNRTDLVEVECSDLASGTDIDYPVS